MCSNKYKQRHNWQRRGSLLAACRQVGYFHCAASCVIKSLSTGSSPADTVCFWGFLFFSQQLPHGSGSLEKCLSLYCSYLRRSEYTHSVWVQSHWGRGDYHPITCPPLSLRSFTFIRPPARTTQAIIKTKTNKKNDLFLVRLTKTVVARLFHFSQVFVYFAVSNVSLKFTASACPPPGVSRLFY